MSEQAQGQPQAQEARSDGRDENGRFAKGNKHAVGNPFARQVAELRQEMLDCVTREEMRAVSRKLIDMAKEGCVPAAKLLLSYTLGKPAPAKDPDRLDFEEWENFKDTARMLNFLPELVTVPEAKFPLETVRATRVGITRECFKQTSEELEKMSAKDRADERRKERRRAKRAERKTAEKPRLHRHQRPMRNGCRSSICIGSRRRDRRQTVTRTGMRTGRRARKRSSPASLG